jgi:hypothetical protein
MKTKKMRRKKSLNLRKKSCCCCWSNDADRAWAALGSGSS